ncbi:TadE/TadG family type IV pilus assembly protein [Flexivirga alba]|uniref:Pilus assembly protein TadG-related protein n=1 Tax=Flexivirga alba TaxID=702742 RepID=A0ABW2AB33_9MICO
MRRLTRLLTGRRASGERGAIAVLTATLVMFVAIGMLALTVDIGNITYNRAELQNGADATSLALAAACAKPSSPGQPCSVTDSLRQLAAQNANVTDQSMSILGDNRTCIANYTGTTSLPPCPNNPATADAAALSNCQPWPLTVAPSKVSYVEVTTQTAMKNGGTILPYYFGQLLAGSSQGSTQRTCSRAAWGPAGSTGPTLPITMGACDWNNATSSGAKYATAPPYTVAAGSGSAPPPEVTTPTNLVTGIFAHATSSNLCANQPNGGFSWLQPDSTTNPNCNVTIGTGDMAQSNPGGSVPCQGVLSKYLGTVANVPVFDYTTGTGNGAQYHIIGVAAFYLAGYDNVPSAQPKKTSSVYNEPTGVCTGSCTPSTTYVWGWFVSSLLPVNSATINPGGQSLGANVVVPAG